MRDSKSWMCPSRRIVSATCGDDPTPHRAGGRGPRANPRGIVAIHSGKGRIGAEILAFWGRLKNASLACSKMLRYFCSAGHLASPGWSIFACLLEDKTFLRLVTCRRFRGAIGMPKHTLFRSMNLAPMRKFKSQTNRALARRPFKIGAAETSRRELRPDLWVPRDRSAPGGCGRRSLVTNITDTT